MSIHSEYMAFAADLTGPDVKAMLEQVHVGDVDDLVEFWIRARASSGKTVQSADEQFKLGFIEGILMTVWARTNESEADDGDDV